MIDNCHPNSFEYCKLQLFDAKTEDLSCLFYEIIAFIDAAHEAGGKCFVHCHQGVSRSCTFVIAYLICHLKLSYDEAFAKVQEARPICNPNTGFICQLLDFDRRLKEPMKQPRAYRITRHAPHVADCTNICARSVSGEGNTLESDDCYVLHTVNRTFLWIGSAAKDDCVAAAKVHVQRLQLHESAPRSCDMVTAGEETPSFWNAASSCGFRTPVATSVPAPASIVAPEPKGFELLKLNMAPDAHPEPLSVRGKAEPDTEPPRSRSKDDVSIPKMFGFPDWDEIEMFDMDDLSPDQAFVVVPAGNPAPCIHVWMGQDFVEDFGYSKVCKIQLQPVELSLIKLAAQGPEMAGEFLALQNMPSSTEVKIEIDEEETEDFWDCFVNG